MDPVEIFLIHYLLIHTCGSQRRKADFTCCEHMVQRFLIAMMSASGFSCILINQNVTLFLLNIVQSFNFISLILSCHPVLYAAGGAPQRVLAACIITYNIFVFPYVTRITDCV